MEVLLLYCCLLVFIGQIYCKQNTAVPFSECDVTPLSVYSCGSDYPFSPTVSLRNTDDDGGKAFDYKVDIEETITDDFTVDVIVDKYNNGGWQENFYRKDGRFCDFISKFVPKPWKKIREQIQPAIEEDCDIQPGSYELTDYQASPKDVDIPVSESGRFRITVMLRNPDEEDYGCMVLELEINSKD